MRIFNFSLIPNVSISFANLAKIRNPKTICAFHVFQPVLDPFNPKPEHKIYPLSKEIIAQWSDIMVAQIIFQCIFLHVRLLI